ncbi:S-layer homology domain-containing protein [Savagea sp. SN6]|uniref:S-layer homology domain-containing protein n=1 Tax=Savagea serpentis TaxID=2785297 RepID=A0A8J7KTC2_9BACL|nr:S-layer homology domain-containing protein [Savagea serpentis]MBF4501414.1 S-layer homology domain-containing protein [Savagea serpentis]
MKLWKQSMIWLLLFVLVALPLGRTQAKGTFTDVPASYEEAVQYMVNKGIQGMSPTEFGVAKTITRGDAAVYLARTLNVWNEEAPEVAFTDIPAHRQDAQIAIRTLYELGIIQGKTNKLYGFSDEMTRGELALIVTKEAAFDLHVTTETNLPFTDVNERYQEAVQALVAHGVTNGVSATKYGTVQSMKRGDFAKMLFVLDGGVIDNPDPGPSPEPAPNPDPNPEPQPDPNGLVLKTLTNAKGFQWIEGKRLTVMEINEGVILPILQETGKGYEVAFGNGVVTFLKEEVHIQEGHVPAVTKGKQTVLTKRNTPMRFEAKGKVVGTIQPDMRLVILGEEGTQYRIQIGGVPVYVDKKDTMKDSGVPVLMYHHMLENAAQSSQKNNRMVIDVRQFEEQMAYLNRHNWTPITLNTFKAWKNGEINLHKRVVLITFDDGILSTVKYAYPILKQYNYPAVSFLISGKLRQQAAPWDPDGLQNVGLKEMAMTEDIYNFQSHTHYMHVFKKGTREGLLLHSTKEEVYEDVMASKAQIAKGYAGDTSHIIALAYPFGQNTQAAREALKEAEIEFAFTTQPGTVLLGDDPLLLNRQGIAPEHTLKHFEQKLNNTFK